MASATGSAGTIASGDYLKKLFPDSKIVASEALQCPTLLENGFGAHRIEGIGDKHVPWIHNTKNTDVVTAIDDNAVVSLSRLFNEETGRAYLVEKGVPEALVSNLDLLGFSGISNVLSCIKAAKYYEMTENDIMLTVLTDSMDLYRSRIHEMNQEFGPYSEKNAAGDFAQITETAEVGAASAQEAVDLSGDRRGQLGLEVAEHRLDRELGVFLREAGLLRH